MMCPPIAGQPCTAPVDCAGQFCGSHASVLDELGCPRATCDDVTDCGPGEGCRLATSPLQAPVTCVDLQGTCTCTLGQGVVKGVCVPEALLAQNLAAHCAALTDQAACDVFAVPEWSTCHWEPTELYCAGHCASGAESGACIAFGYAGDGCLSCGRNPAGTPYWRPRAGGTEIFFSDPDNCGYEPQGWKNCSDGGTPACQCFCA